MDDVYVYVYIILEIKIKKYKFIKNEICIFLKLNFIFCICEIGFL